SKRKKDGVFYTPKYITKYIVENTLGKLCAEKKAALEITDEIYSTAKKRSKKRLDNLQQYRDWLLQLSICDPACGSGAFLNQALEFLIEEHRYLDELSAKYNNDPLVLSDVETGILENNLYGVDINEESVHIAKLSLWLRTAQRNRKLNDLNKNLKCGNSLIDDPEIAGKKAFDWEKEFPQVFKEKNKKAFHITTAVHDSRTSQRMIDYKVRQKRFMGSKPFPDVIPFTEKEELLVCKIVSEIVEEDDLKLMAFNICWDHMHLLLVCEETEVSKIMQKIKSKTGRAVNIERAATRQHAALSKSRPPVWTQKFGNKPITGLEQLQNTEKYIRTNRTKHNLPPLQQGSMLPCLPYLSSYEEAFRTEYVGGFDVVVGNPPYLSTKGIDEKQKEFFKKEYSTAKGQFDLYGLFMEKSFQLLKKKGIFSFITSNTFIGNKDFIELRKFLLKKTIIKSIINLGETVFEDANLDVAILTFQKSDTPNNSNNIKVIKNKNDFDLNLSNQVDQSNFNNELYNFEFKINCNQKDFNLLNKLFDESLKLSEILNLPRGIEIGSNSEKINSNTALKPIIFGKNISRYVIDFESNYIQFESNPSVFKTLEVFEQPKILIQRIRNLSLKRRIIATYDEEGFLCTNTLRIENLINQDFDLKFILSILNSKLINYLFLKFFMNKDIYAYQLQTIPIKNISVNQQPFIEKAEKMLSLNAEFQKALTKFTTYFSGQYNLQKLPRKLENWHELDFPGFVKELNKAIKKEKGTPLSKKDEFEWMDLFGENQQKAQALQAEIAQNDREIDAMVYELYGLTEEEIAVVENS
ncbi:MAG TPA: TaqI-like C-terminal specificity domain-containing protein, partial [Flavobacteriaceae bacterium]|nr:TaqI-like C-terminal specificity domain-containing protein [Flavobacteriaceae bacterium]